MAGSDSFAVEYSKVDRTVDWMNEYAKKNSKKFEAKKQGYILETVRFGKFEPISWKGDWGTARMLIKKASTKLNVRIIESGYHQKRDLLTAMLGGAEFAKVYSSGRLLGQIELGLDSGKWYAKAEYNA